MGGGVEFLKVFEAWGEDLLLVFVYYAYSSIVLGSSIF